MMSHPRLAKFAAVLLALSALAATFTLVPPKAKAADTPNSWFVPVAGAPVGVSFYDVEWTPDGKWALWVGSTGSFGVAWWYELATGGWTQAMCVDDGASTRVGTDSAYFKTVTWITDHPSWDNSMLVVGDCGGGGAFFFAPLAIRTSIYEQHMAPIANFIAEESIFNPYVLYAPTTANVTVAGYKAGVGAFCYEYSTSNEDWGTGSPKCSYTSNPSSIWYDVAIDPSELPQGDIYLVGRNGLGSALYQVWDSSTRILNTKVSPAGFVQINTIELDNSAAPPYMIFGHGTSGSANVFYKAAKAAHFDQFTPIAYPNGASTSIYDMDFDSTGVGVAIGEWNYEGDDYGLIVDIWRDGSDYKAVRRSDSELGGTFYNTFFQGASMAPAGHPLALICGSAYKYYYNAATSNVQVDSMYPHIDYIDLYDAGMSVSKLNSQIDVDPGDYSTWYDFTVRAYDNAGQTNILQVDVYAWYDGGPGGSENKPVPFDGVADTENSRMHFHWNRYAAPTWSKMIPSGATDESVIWEAGCSSWDEPDLKNVTLRFRICAGPQMRAADGPFNNIAGSRYGGGVSGGQSDDTFPYAPLNALDTWNLHVVVTDSGGIEANAYDEFGIYRFTYIGTSGLPGGGAIRGAGAPNTQATLTPANDVTYNSNCPYQLTTSVTNLVGQNLGQTIPATLICITGGQISSQTWFTGAGVPQYLYGSSPATYVDPRGSLRFTTTSNAVGGIGEPMWWYCDIPGVQEDYYKGTITYSILHG